MIYLFFNYYFLKYLFFSDLEISYLQGIEITR